MASAGLIKSLLRSNVIVLVLSNLNNLFNYLTQLVLGRALSPEDYGIYNAVNSLGLIAGSLFMALPFVVAKFILKHEARPLVQRALIRRMVTGGAVLCAVLAAAWLALSGQLAAYLQLPERMPVMLYLLWLVSMLYVFLLTGVLNGYLLYVRSTLQTFTQGLFRLVFSAVVVVGLALSYNAAILASGAANVLTAAWMAVSVRSIGAGPRRRRPAAVPPGEMAAMARFALPVGLNWVAIGFMTNIDIVMVKHFLDPRVAGLYAVAAVTSRIAFFLPLMLLAVLFPEVAKSTQDQRSSLPIIMVTLGITVLLSGSFAVVVLLFPEEIITLLFGAKYAVAAGYLPIITCAMALLAVINVLFSAFLAQVRFAFLYPTYAGLALTAGLIHFHLNGSPAQVATGVLLGCGFILLSNLGVALVTLGGRRPFSLGAR